MPERSTISQAVQIGVEATPGTAVAASKRLGSVGFQIGAQIDTSAQRPTGQKYANLHVLNREWSEADIEGSPVYDEMQYLFSSLINTGTVAQIMDGTTATGAYRWVFESSSFKEDNPKTLTLEQGSSARAHRIVNGVITDLTVEFSREEVELDGSLIARRLEDGITMTANPTSLPQVPIKPGELSVYLDAAHTDLGTTKMTRAISGEIGIESRYGPLWVVDAAQPSFANVIETEPEVSFTLTQMADAQAMATLTAMRGGASRFLRLEAVGPVIYAGATTVNYLLRMDFAGQVSDVSPFDDEDGVYAIEWEFGGVHDGAWGRAFRIELINRQASL